MIYFGYSSIIAKFWCIFTHLHILFFYLLIHKYLIIVCWTISIMCNFFVTIDSSPQSWLWTTSSSIVSSSLVLWSLKFATMCISQGQILQAIALELKDHIYVTLKKDLMFFFVGYCFKAWSTHPTKVILFSSMWLLLNIATSLTFLNVALNDLKQYTSNGCRTCDLCDGEITQTLRPILLFIK